MRRTTMYVTAVCLLLVSGCDVLGRGEETVQACTAVLQAQDAIANREPEAVEVREFYESAYDAENPELVSLAEEAEEASTEQDIQRLERVLKEAETICQEEGGA